MINSPVSAQPNHGNLFFSDHKIENGTTLSRYPMEGQFTPPTKLRTDKSNGRKREYDHRDSSEESETPGRRQADDVTPKLKRRQPKVAEAYR